MSPDQIDGLNSKLTSQFEILGRCIVRTPQREELLLASPPGTRYPYFYPRDAASASALLRRVAVSPHGYDSAPKAFELLAALASFSKRVLSKEGFWGQRYSVEGEDKGIYRQEDNTAHGISILANFLLCARELEKEIPDLEDFLAAIATAATAALHTHYRPELNLFYSTTAIHESELERGYTCWVNFSYLYAFSLVHEVAQKLNPKAVIPGSLLDFRQHFLYSVSELFIYGQRYVRRISTKGHIDQRPDITLLSPFYYGFVEYGDALRKGARFLERHLWDSELGMVMRYLPFQQDNAVHVHAGHGPWLQYTAILAQFHYWDGNRERGDELMGLIEKYSNDEGEIPEHLSTCERFERFMESEWRTGIDFAKEFHSEILLADCSFDKILEEANNMARSYKESGEHCSFRDQRAPGGGHIQFAAPLMWSHVEYSRALLYAAGDWWFKSG